MDSGSNKKELILYPNGYVSVRTVLDGSGNVCMAFNTTRNGTCYNDERKKTTYDYCQTPSTVTECFVEGGGAGDYDVSVYTTSYGFSGGIPCPENHTCPKGGRACVPMKACSADSDCGSCMSCVNGRCNYDDTRSCSSCSGGECACAWGVCENAACTSDRLNSFDCSQCTSFTGDCAKCCGLRESYRCVLENRCYYGTDPSACSGGCADGFVCCFQPGTSMFMPKDCGLVSSADCNFCCPHVTAPCEARTQRECTIETDQCSWCSDGTASSCVNITSSNDFCGSCTNACTEDWVCRDRNCVFNPPDCRNRLDQSKCEQYSSNDACRWCPVPPGTNNNEFSTYPYFMLGQEEGSSSACVNTSYDPFNCGQCGFDSSPGGFCSASTPFCVNGVCSSRTTVGVAAFTRSLRSDYPGSANQYFSAYPVVSESRGGEKADFLDINYAYAASDADTNQEACTMAGGSWDSTYGCCGNNKCRSLGSAACDVSRICNGTSWIIAKNPSGSVVNNGQVFRPNTCFNSFPIANINGEFIKCIDTAQYDSYVAKLGQAGINGCSQPGSSAASGASVVPLSGSLQYSCPAGYYVGASVAADSCGLQGIGASARSSGYLVCIPSQSSGSMGFASILVNTPSLSFQQSYSSCPAPINSWMNASGGEIIAYEQAFIPCPGMKPMPDALPSGTSLSLALTGLSGDRTYTAAFCSQGINTQQDSGDSGLYALDYVRGDGSIMGVVNGHQYACYTPSANNARIAVCCGDDATCLNNPMVGTGGMAYSTGQSITISGTTRFCKVTGTWSDDLDSPALQGMCTSAGQAATGNYCCSEADDVRAGGFNESYNDLNSQVGACLKGTFQNNNRTARYNNQDYANIYVKNGTFYGCGFSSTFSPETTGTCTLDSATGRLSQACLESIQNWPNPGSTSAPSPSQPLIQRSPACTLIKASTGDRYCAFDNTWKSTGGRDLSAASYVPSDLMNHFLSFNPDLESSNCCQPSECWNPAVGQCIASQSGAGQGTYDYPLDENTVYRCVNGQWRNIIGLTKRAPYTCQTGFCPQDSDCLYDPYGNVYDNYNVSGNPQCLADGQFKDDYICENGLWTSRTKKLALKMLSMVPSSSSNEGYFSVPFTLMCSSPSDVLVSEDRERAQRSPGFQDIGNPDKANAYCVLEIDRNIRIIGTTLNSNLTDAPGTDFIYSLDYSFMNVYPNATVDFSHTCTPSTTNFARCINNPLLQLYYDKTYKMAIFSAQNFDAYMAPGLGQTICNSLPQWLSWLCAPPTQLEENLKSRQLFNNVYLSRQRRVDAYGQTLNTFTEIFGVAEGNCDLDTQAFARMYSFNYTGMSTVISLGHLVLYTDAEVKALSHYPLNNNLHNIFLKNPTNMNTWVALTLLRNTGQK